MKNTRDLCHGFTIVELMIATAVFSMVLLVSLTGFLQIGQIFYKGVTISSTNEAATSILNGLRSDIAFGSDLSYITPRNSSSSGVKYLCAGTNRYTYKLGYKVDTSNHNFTSNFGLVKDTLSTSGCPDPFGGTAFNSPTELLGDKARLSNLDINQLAAPNDKLYNVNVRVAYGDDEVLQNPTSASATCVSNSKDSRYCYVSDLKTTVRKGY